VSAKLTLYPPQRTSRFFLLAEGESRLAGRETASDVVLEDPRVSARHARFEWSGPGWNLVDLGSKNGTFVNGFPVTSVPLVDEDWISFGGLLSQFEVLSEREVRALDAERNERLQTTAELRRELSTLQDPRSLLRRLLDSVLDVAGAERGFVLLLDPAGTLRAEIASGFASLDPIDERFSGSLGAIEAALRVGRSVVASDARSDAFLGKRPSVVERGIAALACVPLRSDDRVIGLIYVDGRKRGGGFTDLDLEILEALADQAALVVATAKIERQIRELLGEPSPDGQRFFEALERQVGEIARKLKDEREMADQIAPSA
jgi:pSer/pThr/pTyr-binding forkhead associated (FHA) protein